MPFRFRRTIRVLPGLRLNLSKSGLSVSAGKRGANVTLGHGKTRTTVGLPGSGVSYTTTSSTGRRRSGIGWRPGTNVWNFIVGVVILLAIAWWLGWL